MAIKDDFKRGFESGGATANILEGETASKFFTERVPAKLDLEQVKRIVDNLSEAIEENLRVKVYAEFDSPEKLGGDIPYQRNVALFGEHERGILMADTIDIHYD